MSLKVVYFGTPDAAVPTLNALSQSSFEVVLVVTAPDRESGRGMKLTQSPVGNHAEELGIDVFKPASLRTPEAHQRLAASGAKAFVVCAYGLILPTQILELPELGCLNVHFSLLPKLRGAAPVVWALIQGESETGVSIMKMDEGVDTGPIISTLRRPISDVETAGELTQDLAELGASLLVKSLSDFADGRAQPVPQDDSLASSAPRIGPDDAHLDWRLSPAEIVRRVRAFNPRPGAWGHLKGKRLKVLKASIAPANTPMEKDQGIVNIGEDGGMIVSATSGSVELLEVQPEGSQPMTGADFLRGRRGLEGEEMS